MTHELIYLYTIATIDTPPVAAAFSTKLVYDTTTLPRMPVVSGLMCTHTDCYALFISLDDSEEHAISTHGGNVAAITCGVYECRDESKTTHLYRVLDKDGECFNKYLRVENSTQDH